MVDFKPMIVKVIGAYGIEILVNKIQLYLDGLLAHKFKSEKDQFTIKFLETVGFQNLIQMLTHASDKIYN
jgi:hypothetical protein